MKTQRQTRRSEEGSAVVVILILLFLMLAFSMANSRALSNLKKEMQVMEANQVKKFESGTNTVRVPAERK
ncbi:MAG: hypothetical protein JWM68_1295 [Verrucomicrobiales bacterium]|nr:hypothetical protein [Verrucomicrobiales bacterium]